MRTETMRKKLTADKARLLKKIEDEKTAHARKVEPLQQQVGLIDRMLAELDTFEKQSDSVEGSQAGVQKDSQDITQQEDLPSFLRKPPASQH